MNSPTPDPKHVATITAQLARVGLAVHKLEGDGYLVVFPCSTRHCQNFADLVNLARQQGVPQ